MEFLISKASVVDRAHVAVFYLFGAYVSISSRFAGVRYVSLASILLARRSTYCFSSDFAGISKKNTHPSSWLSDAGRVGLYPVGSGWNGGCTGVFEGTSGGNGTAFRRSDER